MSCFIMPGGPPPPDPRDTQIATLMQIVQALQETMDNQPTQPAQATNMVLQASPLGPSILLAPTQIKVNTTLLDRYNGDADLQTHPPRPSVV